MSKTVYISNRGDDGNDGLSYGTPVFTPERAIKISIREGATTFHVAGGAPYKRRVNAELEKAGTLPPQKE